MAIIATPMAVDANSYLTRDEATTILTTRRLHGAAWTSAPDATKDAALIWATRLLDQGFEWYGSLRTFTQALRWPRYGMLDNDYRNVDPDTIPERLKEATADLALALIQRDRVSDPELLGLGFREAKVGNLSVVIDPKMILDLIPRHILKMIDIWGDPIDPGIGGMGTYPLERV